MRRSVLTRAREGHARHAWPHTNVIDVASRISARERRVLGASDVYNLLK